MKYLITILIFFSLQAMGRESGQTEITTDDGIEVFNKEKYYLFLFLCQRSFLFHY